MRLSTQYWSPLSRALVPDNPKTSSPATQSLYNSVPAVLYQVQTQTLHPWINNLVNECLDASLRFPNVPHSEHPVLEILGVPSGRPISLLKNRNFQAGYIKLTETVFVSFLCWKVVTRPSLRFFIHKQSLKARILFGSPRFVDRLACMVLPLWSAHFWTPQIVPRGSCPLCRLREAQGSVDV